MALIYQPSDDSYLLQESLKVFLKKIKNKNLKILDMGTGSGIQLMTCKDLGFSNIFGVDINLQAVKNLKKLGFIAIYSDLFNKVKDKFDLIIFNPPYLPDDKEEPVDSKLSTTAGKEGNEIILRFLKDAKSHLKPHASILLLFSNLSKPKVILNESKILGYNSVLLSKKKLFFEELYVYKFYIE
jgi:release factor glutamine methyltransferase